MENKLQNSLPRHEWRPVGAFLLGSLSSLFAFFKFDSPGSSLASVLGFALGMSIILGLHVLDPKLDPRDAFVSQYALDSKNGRWMRIAFFLIAVASFNLAFVLIRLDFGFPLGISILIAGVFSMMMGFFSQKSGKIDDITNSEFEGNLHSLSAALSFGSATVSMLIFAISFEKSAAFQWVRGTALSLFSVTFLTVLLQIVLGLRKIEIVKEVKRDAGKSEASTAQIMRTDFRKSADAFGLFVQGISPSSPEDIRSDMLPEHTKDENIRQLVRANQGLGITERILIFLFLIWAIALAVVTYYYQRSL